MSEETTTDNESPEVTALRAAFPDFEPMMEGVYMVRHGPAIDCPSQERPHLKLCITTRNQEVLVQELLEVSRLPHCFAVKFSTQAKEGMYLGRTYILGDEENGRLWQKFKRHPHFYCSLQDDGYTARFRESYDADNAPPHPSPDTGPIASRFEPFMNGSFFLRRGPAHGCPPEERLHIKLCITATDQQRLADELYRLSLDPRCYAVKFAARAKAGMYLGRVFLQDEEELGRLWQVYKRHPHFYCSLQDDNFVNKFRPE